MKEHVTFGERLYYVLFCIICLRCLVYLETIGTIALFVRLNFMIDLRVSVVQEGCSCTTRYGKHPGEKGRHD